MFERFTKDARNAVVLAQEEARDLRSPAIGAQHVTLGVLRTGGDAVRALTAAGVDVAAVTERLRAVASGRELDAEALASLGIDLDAVSRSADSVFGAGALERAGRLRRRWKRGHIPFTADAKKALELSLREALRLKDNTISDRHVLLGVLRGGGPAAEVLLGAAPEAELRGSLEAGPEAA